MVKRPTAAARAMNRRTSGRTVAIELMMDCQSEELSPSQVKYMKKCRLEYDNAMAMIKAAQAKARVGMATVSMQNVYTANIPPPKPVPVVVNTQTQAPRSTSPDVIIVGESPPPVSPAQKSPPKPPPTLAPAPIPPPTLVPQAPGTQQYIIRSSIGNTLQGPLRLVPLNAAMAQYQQRPPVPVQVAPPKHTVITTTAAQRITQPQTNMSMSATSMLVNSAIMAKRHLENTQDSAGPAKKKLKKTGDVADSIGSWVPLDEYYYGKMEGDPAYTEEKGEYRFKCWYCSKMLYNNIKAMMHIQGHIDSGKQHNLDLSDLTQCKHCYKQFDTPFEMQTHVEKVHMNGANVLLCRICERDHESRNALTHHMRQNHNACEMPYLCQLCSFRSSMYSDVVDHFKKKHDSSQHILCLYCLKVFKVKFVTLGWGQTQTYYGHLLKHQSKTSTKKCTLCRLTFYNVPDVKAHKKKDHMPNHKGVLGANNRYSTPGQVMIKVPESGLQPKQQSVKSLNAPAVSKVLDFGGTRFPTIVNYLTCLECKMSMGTPDHFKKYIECSMCRFATSCSIAYANHMMGFHSCQVSSLNLNIPWERRMESPMYCLCGFGSRYGNKIASHLVYCTKRTCYVSKPDLPTAEEGYEEGYDEDIDPRRKPGASILDVLGLVKKRTIATKEEVAPEIIRRPSREEPPAFISTKSETPDRSAPPKLEKMEPEEVVPPELTGSLKWSTVKIQDTEKPSKASVFLGADDDNKEEDDQDDDDLDVSLSDELQATIQHIVDENLHDDENSKDKVDENIKDKVDDKDENVTDKVDDENVKDKVDDENVKDKVDDENVKDKVDDENVKDKVDDENVKDKVDDENVKDKVDDENVKDKVDDEIVEDKVHDENVKDKVDENVDQVDESVHDKFDESVDEIIHDKDSERTTQEEESKLNDSASASELMVQSAELTVQSADEGVADISDVSTTLFTPGGSDGFYVGNSKFDNSKTDGSEADTNEQDGDDVLLEGSSQKKSSESVSEGEVSKPDCDNSMKEKSMEDDDVESLNDNEIDELLKDETAEGGDSKHESSPAKPESSPAKHESSPAKPESSPAKHESEPEEWSHGTTDNVNSNERLSSEDQNKGDKSNQSEEKESAKSEEVASPASVGEHADMVRIESSENVGNTVPEVRELDKSGKLSLPDQELLSSEENESATEDTKIEQIEIHSTEKDAELSGETTSAKGDSSSDMENKDSSMNATESSGTTGDGKEGDSKSYDRGHHSNSQGNNSENRHSQEQGDSKSYGHGRDRDRHDDQDRSGNRGSKYDDRTKSDNRDSRSRGNYRSHGDGRSHGDERSHGDGRSHGEERSQDKYHHGDRSHDTSRDWDRNHHGRSYKDDRNWAYSDNRSYHGNQDHRNHQGHRDNRNQGNGPYGRDGRDDRRPGNYHDNYQSNRNQNYRGRGGYGNQGQGNQGGYQGNYR